jgi:hypothetical protein
MRYFKLSADDGNDEANMRHDHCSRKLISPLGSPVGARYGLVEGIGAVRPNRIQEIGGLTCETAFASCRCEDEDCQ